MSAMARGILIGAVGTLLLLVLIALLVVLTGGYNVAATERHSPLVGWALTTTMRNSVQNASADLVPPEAVTPAMITAGAGEYKSMCAQCHGGVGEERAEWASTMRPIPPPLAHAASEWSIEEVHWLVTHGVRMSGMPAFGPTHDEATIWNIAAFVTAMPDMTAAQYAAYPSDHGGEGHSHGGEASAQAQDHVDPPGAPAHSH